VRLARIKLVAEVVTGQSPPSEMVEDFEGTGMPFLQGNAEFGRESPFPVKRCDTATRRARVGDVLLSIRAPVGALNIADRDYGIGRGLAALRPRSKDLDARYLWWGLHALVPVLQSSAVGSTYDAVTGDDIGDIALPMPPLDRQRQVADYLDAETTRIDALVTTKQRMIDLLGERRQAAIDHLVMGQGGQRVRVRHLIRRLTSGPRGWAEHVADRGVLFLRIANVSANDIELDMKNVAYVQPPSGAERERTMVRDGDVLVSITAEIGSVGVTRSEHAGAAISQHVALMTPSGCGSDWLAFALTSTAARAQFDSARYGGTKSQLALDDVRDVEIEVLNPKDEARTLDQLRSITRTIRSAQAVLARQILLISEHRQALITAGVTGALEIPGVAA
jgi:type I restriction enzyme, S subunit